MTSRGGKSRDQRRSAVESSKSRSWLGIARTASEFIAEHEGLERGQYGRAVGCVYGAGNGTFAVANRCAEISGFADRLFAGGDIVADSDPLAELAENQAKLQAMVSPSSDPDPLLTARI